MMNTSCSTSLIPDMDNRSGKIYMTHPLSPYSRIGDFDTTSFTDDTLISHSLILSTATFKILYWSKYGLTKESTMLWLTCSIINCICVINRPMRPLFNFLWWCKFYHQTIEYVFLHMTKEEKIKKQVTPLSWTILVTATIGWIFQILKDIFYDLVFIDTIDDTILIHKCSCNTW